MSCRVTAASTTTITTAAASSSIGSRTRQFVVALLIVVLVLEFLDVTSALIEDADRETIRDGAQVDDHEEIHRSIQFDDARLHYRLSTELIHLLKDVGLQLPPTADSDDVDESRRRRVYQVNSSLDSGSTNHCVILFGNVISRTEPAAAAATGLTVQFADDVDMTEARLTTITMSFLKYRRKANDRMTSHETDEWCVRAMTSSGHVTDAAVAPGLPLIAENENQTEVEELSEVTADNMTLSSESNQVHDDPPVLSRLNKRQILVISTCSTVIGSFSVVALILRIRNYMKRTKQDKDATRRHGQSNSLNVPRSHQPQGSLDAFGPGGGGHHDGRQHDRRWSHFNPFSTDR